MSESELERTVRTTASGKAYGVTPAGFVPKPAARLLAEKLAAARALFGADVDLTSGSALRTLLEVVAVEESRLWAHLGLAYADSYVSTATGEALSRLGAELGLPRPHHRATGEVGITLTADLPAHLPAVDLPRGTRLRADGGAPVFLRDHVRLDGSVRTATAAVAAFEPGPAGDLDPAALPDGTTPGRIASFEPLDPRTAVATGLLADGTLTLTHSAPLSGGAQQWSDERYRDLLLAYPRNLWTPDAVRVAVTLVPGVRQAVVRDLYGGLDIHQTIFGNVSFAERLFAEQRSLVDPSFVTILVAPEDGAVWDGPGQLRERVGEAVDQVRPIGVGPAIERAELVGVGFGARIVVDGLPTGAGPAGSTAVAALLGRIQDRVRRYVSRLRIGEPVRYSEVMWAVMNEPGVVDVRDLQLLRYPPRLTDALPAGTTAGGTSEPVALACGEDVTIAQSEVAVLVPDPARTVVV